MALYRVVKKCPTLHISICNTDNDHVHIQISIPPSISVADVVRNMKATSSQLIKKKFPFVSRIYTDGSIWSVGYFVSTVGINEATIRKYIEYQSVDELPKTLDLGFDMPT